MSASRVDRISELPESLISHILSLLPTKTAFKTSFLSKTWKLHWTKVTAFNFDDSVWHKTSEFEEFVNRALINHSGESINKFRLKSKSSYMWIWAEAAIARNVKVLDLDIMRRTLYLPHLQTEVFTLPNSIYTCGTLEILKLRGCFRVRLVPVVCLPKLTFLLLEKVIFESEEYCVGKLISGSPMLQSLSIRKPSACTISSPTLKRLRIFTDNNFIHNFKVEGEIDAPALEGLSVVCDDDMSMEITIQGQTSAKVYLDCPAQCSSRFSRFYANTMTILAKATKNRFPECLERTTVQFNVNIEWSCLMDLLDRCINLQVLEISYEYLSSVRGEGWNAPVCVPKCVSSSLKEVRFKTFCHSQDEGRLLLWIQEHGLVLQRVELCRDPRKYKAYPRCEIAYS